MLVLEIWSKEEYYKDRIVGLEGSHFKPGDGTFLVNIQQDEHFTRLSSNSHCQLISNTSGIA